MAAPFACESEGQIEGGDLRLNRCKWLPIEHICTPGNTTFYTLADIVTRDGFKAPLQDPNKVVVRWVD